MWLHLDYKIDKLTMSGGTANPIQVEASPTLRQAARHNCLILPHLGTFDDTLCSEEIRSNHGTWWNYSTSAKAMPNYLQGIYQVASSACHLQFYIS